MTITDGLQWLAILVLAAALLVNLRTVNAMIVTVTGLMAELRKVLEAEQRRVNTGLDEMHTLRERLDTLRRGTGNGGAAR